MREESGPPWVTPLFSAKRLPVITPGAAPTFLCLRNVSGAPVSLAQLHRLPKYQVLAPYQVRPMSSSNQYRFGRGDTGCTRPGSGGIWPWSLQSLFPFLQFCHRGNHGTWLTKAEPPEFSHWPSKKVLVDQFNNNHHPPLGERQLFPITSAWFCSPTPKQPAWTLQRAAIYPLTLHHSAMTICVYVGKVANHIL